MFDVLKKKHSESHARVKPRFIVQYNFYCSVKFDLVATKHRKLEWFDQFKNQTQPQVHNFPSTVNGVLDLLFLLLSSVCSISLRFFKHTLHTASISHFYRYHNLKQEMNEKFKCIGETWTFSVLMLHSLCTRGQSATFLLTTHIWNATNTTTSRVM